MRSWQVASLIVALTAAGVRADMLSKPRIQVNGSLGIPTNSQTFTEVYSLGFGGGIGAEVPMSASFKMSATVDFTTFDLDTDEYLASRNIPPATSIAGGEASVLYVAGNLKLNVLAPRGSPVRPYVLAGGGYFRMATDDIVLATSTVVQKTEHVLGLHGGWGIDIALGTAINLFFDALYVVGSTEGKNTGYLPVRAGLTFSLVPQI